MEHLHVGDQCDEFTGTLKHTADQLRKRNTVNVWGQSSLDETHRPTDLPRARKFQRFWLDFGPKFGENARVRFVIFKFWEKWWIHYFEIFALSSNSIFWDFYLGSVFFMRCLYRTPSLSVDPCKTLYMLICIRFYRESTCTQSILVIPKFLQGIDRAYSHFQLSQDIWSFLFLVVFTYTMHNRCVSCTREW